MFYAAILLILIGLISLLYIVITTSIEKKEIASEENADSPKDDFNLSQNESPKQTKTSVDFTNLPDLPDPEPIQVVPKPHIPNVPHPKEIKEDLGFQGEVSHLNPPDTLLDKEKLKNALKSLEKKEFKATQREIPAEEPQILVNGILFFDHGRQFPERMQQMDDLPERFYHELKRMGSGNLIIKGRKIMIHSQNAQYNYNTKDLEQILFLPKGVGFVPLNIKRPVPIFLTEESDKIKAFIRQYSLNESQGSN